MKNKMITKNFQEHCDTDNQLKKGTKKNSLAKKI